MKRTKSMVYRPTQEANELVLYAENTGDLYRNSIQPAIESLAKKYRKGVYDKNRAVDLYYYIATEAAKMYSREFGYNFSVTDRYTAAVELEESYFENVRECAKN